jgi:hypothetical protein
MDGRDFIRPSVTAAFCRIWESPSTRLASTSRTTFGLGPIVPSAAIASPFFAAFPSVTPSVKTFHAVTSSLFEDVFLGGWAKEPAQKTEQEHKTTARGMKDLIEVAL